MTMVTGALLVACSTPSSPKEGEMTNETAEPKKQITATIYDRGTVPPAEGTIEKNRWTRWINENAPVNVTFTAVPRNEAQQKLNVLFAAGNAPDVIFEYSPAIKNSLYEQKQLMPLNDVIDKYSTEYKKLLQDFPSLKKAGTKSDGKIYEIGRLVRLEPATLLLIRTDWLKKLNLEVPKTAEDLLKVAKAFTEQDPDGNGQKDTFGINMSSGGDVVIETMFQAGNRWLIKDNQLTYGWNQIKDATAFKKRLYDDGSIDKDFATDKNGARAIQSFATGKLGMYVSYIGTGSVLATQLLDPLFKNLPTAEVDVFPLPKSAYGQFMPKIGNPIQMTAVVNANAKDPKAVMQYLDFMMKETTTYTLINGITGVHSKKDENGCTQPIDAEKFKTEVTLINGSNDFSMLRSSALEKFIPKCAELRAITPGQKAALELSTKGQDIYMNTSLPYSEITHPEHMPQLPKDLLFAQNGVEKQLSDIWLKAIVSGEKYTPDQALADAKAAWEKSSGVQIEEWMKNWYAKEKDNAFLAKDLYDIINKQKEAEKQ